MTLVFLIVLDTTIYTANLHLVSSEVLRKGVLKKPQPTTLDTFHFPAVSILDFRYRKAYRNSISNVIASQP